MTTALTIAITGAGGAGVISCGELLLRAWAGAGGHGLLRKAFGPQIRGGEAAALLSLTTGEDYTAAADYDLLVALDWRNFDRFQDEIRLSPKAIVICENAAEAPPALAACTILELPLASRAAESHPEGRANMLALGLLGASLGLDEAALCREAERRLAGKAEAYREAAVAAIRAGMTQSLPLPAAPPPRDDVSRWCLSGNQAAGYGALAAGIRFVAAYPITPASDLLEWMATPLEGLGGQLLQAEDELAAINMALGAAYGGVPAFTATSGPGLALMSESLGLAVASETPVCVFNVQRGGPSTGIPTKSEQSDLNIALYGLHGDAPHLVLAPLDTRDCVFTTSWAVYLANHLQTAAIVLSDQYIGQSTAVIAEPELFEASPDSMPPDSMAADTLASDTDGGYRRYQITASGISPRAIPGEPDRRYTADGLEHTERGTPSASPSHHQEQLDKRERKLTDHDFGDHWADIEGDGDLALLAFGSSAAVMRAAAAELAGSGQAVTTVALRLLAPLQTEQLAAALAHCRRVIVVEQNHSAQLAAYLRSQLGGRIEISEYARPGPVPLSPEALVRHVSEADSQ